MEWMVKRGSMYLTREEHLIFHACVPVDEEGECQSMYVRGKPYKGKALFDAINAEVFNFLEKMPSKENLDLLWYLWSGPQPPLFGKDKIATLERDLIADEKPHHETKNPYFNLIHERSFCDKILAGFGVDTRQGLIVNGHVPVKLDKGDTPLKRSGKAIIIDGAFSEAYGDHGFTLVMEPHRTFIAKHHHFESVDAAIRDGADIIPSITVVREWDPPKTVADSKRGNELRHAIAALEKLIEIYRSTE